MDASGFLDALLDDPEDATTMLILADYLEDQGDSRAELMRVQGQLASWDPDPARRAELQKRALPLWKEREAEWFGPLLTYCRSRRLQGGLTNIAIEARRFAGKKFGTKAAGWMKEAWVGTVRVLRPVEVFERVCQARALAGVLSLDLSGGELEDTHLESFLASPHLGRLRDLDLTNNALTDDAAQALSESPWFKQLRTLSLRNNAMTGVGVQRLLQASKEARLRRLDVQGNALLLSDAEAVRDWHHQMGSPRLYYGPFGMVFRLIPSGTFPMGSPDAEKERLLDEGPVHEVTLHRPYYLSVFPVTQQQYQWLIGSNPSNFRADNQGNWSHPVESLTWDAADEFCRQLSALPAEKAAKRVYRLPTEAEWEHACRAGDALSRPISWEYSLTSAEANFNGAAPYEAPSGPHLGRTSPVGSYPPTRWGLYDMHGNVWEWCRDWFQDNYYRESPSVDPRGPESGRDGYRVLRGGAYYDPGRYCRCAVRGRNGGNNAHDGLGFRVLLEIR